MAFRNRVWNLEDQSFPSGQATREPIRDAIYRLWFSMQKVVQRLNPGCSPSDYVDRVERLAPLRLGNGGETAAVEDAVRRTFRDAVQDERRTRLRRQIKFSCLDGPQIESIPDKDSGGFADAIAQQSQIEWQIQEIRRLLDPEIMAIIEQLYGFHSDEWTIDSLAKKMGIKRNTLERRVARAFAKLRSEFSSSE